MYKFIFYMPNILVIKHIRIMGIFDCITDLVQLKKKEVCILVLGLNNSGKLTVMNFSKNSNSEVTAKTSSIGYHVKKLKCK